MRKGGGFSAGDKEKKAEQPKPSDPDPNQLKPTEPDPSQKPPDLEQGSIPNPNPGSQPKKRAVTIVLRYYPSADFSPTKVKKALARVKGVASVELDIDERTISVEWEQLCSEVHELEDAAAAAGAPALAISHVGMIITVKPLEGANPKALERGLRAVKGVNCLRADGLTGELHVDVRELTIENLRAVAQTAKYEIQFKTLRWVEAKVSVDGKATVDGVRKKIERTFGTLLMKPNGDTLGFWTGTVLSEQTLRAVAKEAGGTLEIRYP